MYMNISALPFNFHIRNYVSQRRINTEGGHRCKKQTLPRVFAVKMATDFHQILHAPSQKNYLWLRAKSFRFYVKMPNIIGAECEALIKAFSRENMTYRVIVEKLKENGFRVCLSTVSRVVRDIGKRREYKAVGLKTPPKRYPASVLTPRVVKKVDLLTNKQHPPRQRSIAKSVGISKTSVFNCIHHKLKKKLRRKTRVHVLKPRHIRNRKTTARKMYEKYLAGLSISMTVKESEEFVTESRVILCRLIGCMKEEKVTGRK